MTDKRTNGRGTFTIAFRVYSTVDSQNKNNRVESTWSRDRLFNWQQEKGA